MLLDILHVSSVRIRQAAQEGRLLPVELGKLADGPAQALHGGFHLREAGDILLLVGFQVFPGNGRYLHAAHPLHGTQ